MQVEVSNNGVDWVSGGGTFSFAIPPSISQVSPATGSTHGNFAVTLTGSNFARGLSCVFGDNAPADARVISTTAAVCIAPEGKPGSVSLRVTPNGGRELHGSLSFDYHTRMAITHTSPSSGLTRGGTLISVHGFNFPKTGLACSFSGAASLPTAVFISPNLLHCITPSYELPPNRPGSVEVLDFSIIENGGDSTNVVGFSYVRQPSVWSVRPSAGPSGGGSTITVVGSNFQGSGAGCKFGSAEPVPATFVSQSQLVCVSPASGGLTATTTSLYISYNDGSDVTSDSADFAYYAPLRVSSLEPTSAADALGAPVTVRGMDFYPGEGAACRFGTSSAPSPAAVVSSTLIVCTAPKHAVGTVAFSVSGNGVDFTADSGAEFLYVPAPVIFAVSPSSGLDSGGTAVSVLGSNFVTGLTCSFGELIGASSEVISSSLVTCVSPIHPSGTVAIGLSGLSMVAGGGGSSANFEFLQQIGVSKLVPSLGVVGAPNLLIEVVGHGFEDATAPACVFGEVRAEASVLSSTTIVCRAPALHRGSLTVSVTANGVDYAAGSTFIVHPTVRDPSPPFP